MPSAREVAQHSAFLSISWASACQFESSVSINFECLLCRSGSSGGVPAAASTGVLRLSKCTKQPARNALAILLLIFPRWDIRHHYGHFAHIGLRSEKIELKFNFSWTLQVRSCTQASATRVHSSHYAAKLWLANMPRSKMYNEMRLACEAQPGIVELRRIDL